MKNICIAMLCAYAIPVFAATEGEPPGPKYCEAVPELTKTAGKGDWTLTGREVRIDADCLSKEGKPTKGILWLNAPLFGDGAIELDIKGKNEQGKSFVGVAFHASDETHYDAVYFRPFNFKNPERIARSVQYISLPEYEWFTLREKWPGKYENKPNPVPDPDGWFRVRVEVKYPQVKVFVNGNPEPSLQVMQLSSTKEGRIGLWTGNNEGHFRNLTVSPSPK